MRSFAPLTLLLAFATPALAQTTELADDTSSATLETTTPLDDARAHDATTNEPAARAPEVSTTFANEAATTNVPASESTPTASDEPTPTTRLPALRLRGEGAELRVGGLAQLTSEVETADGETDGFVDFRRLRIDLRASFFEGRLRLRSHVSTMPRGAELLDLYVDGRVTEHALVRVGVAKTPFTRQLSINDSVLVDWPIVSRWFGGERQLGVTVEGQPGVASYAVGLYNGDASRPANQRFSTAYGEKAPTRSGFRDATAYDVPHPELMARGGVSLGPVQANVSAAWDVRPEHGVDAAARFALEAGLHTDVIDAHVIGYLALHEELDHDVNAGLGGVLVDASYRLHPRLELAARWSTVLFSDALRHDARATADARIAAAGAEDQARLTQRYADVGQIEALHETTAGFAVYVFGHSLKWQTDASWLRTRRVDGTNDGFRLRLQAQLAF
ncbi:MAG: hypothetical protein H6720_24655 [Sandaracinus sp.]|nr:hypothetical protein [Sandaracinus sp.]